MKKIILFLFALFLSFPNVKAQEDKRLKSMESRLFVIEDYLKNRLNLLHKKISSSNNIIKKLKKNNSQFKKDIEKLKIRLKLAEAEILNLKIEISMLKKIETPKITKKEVITEKIKEKKKVIYKNKRIKKLALQLESNETSIRIGAIVKLRREKNREANKALMEALSDPNMYVKMLACRSLGKRKAKEAVPAILNLLDDTSKNVILLAHKTLIELTNIDIKFQRTDLKKIWKKRLKEVK